MARNAARFTTADVTRAFKGAMNAGFEAPHIKIEPSGAIAVYPKAPPETASPPPGEGASVDDEPNPWDEAVG